MPSHIPHAHQSIAPDRGVVIGLVGVLVVMVVSFVVVTMAVNYGGHECPAKSANPSESACR